MMPMRVGIAPWQLEQLLGPSSRRARGSAPLLPPHLRADLERFASVRCATSCAQSSHFPPTPPRRSRTLYVRA